MALISYNYSFLSHSALYGSKQNHVMNKLPQSLHIFACGEAATHISHVRRGIHRISQTALGKIHQDLTCGKM